MSKQLIEAARISPTQLTGKVWNVKVIEGDRKGSSAYYPKEVVEAGAPLFAKGTRVYGDHPTSDEKWSRPERSYKDIVGVFESDAEYKDGNLYANVKFFDKHMADIKELAEAGVIGMSIRANGDVEETADGPVLKAFTSVTSVDVVTTAGAGGGFEKLLESARNEFSASESEADALKEKETVMELPKEFTAALDALVEASKNTSTAVASLVERAEKEDKAKADALAEANKPKALSPAEIAGKLVEAELPKAAQARVLALVESGADLEESITAEKDYLKEISESAGTKFAGNGSEELQESQGANIGTSMFGAIGD